MLIQRAGLYALGALLAMVSGYAWYLDRTLANERLERVQERLEVQRRTSAALRAQAREHDATIARERARRADAERAYRDLTTELRRSDDYETRMADSVRTYVNFLRERAVSGRAGVSTAADGAADAGGPAGRDAADGDNEPRGDRAGP